MVYSLKFTFAYACAKQKHKKLRVSLGFKIYKPFLGVLCVVGTTPIHPELGGEKATGLNKLYGSPSGKLNLMPRNKNIK
jgi:hypothetical protein